MNLLVIMDASQECPSEAISNMVDKPKETLKT